MSFITPYKLSAIVAYSLLVAGLLLRKNRPLHVRLMASGIILDVIIVFLLEFTRHVIGSAIEFRYTGFQRAHIVTSAIAFVLYLPVVTMGIMRLKNKGGAVLRQWHIGCGITAFIFRTLGVILMFSFI